jgi:hypothetical protein
MQIFLEPFLIFKRIFFLIIIFIFFFESIYCQSEFVNNVKTSFTNYNKQYLQEKVFVHTDKSFYVAGEIIWFKIYNVDAASYNLLDISKVVYVEIINKEQKPILQAKISLKQGLGNGSFYLPFSIASGNYILRAYTGWMKNFSSDYFFEKNITIINSTKRLGLKPKTDSLDYYIQFFPEGGNLVNDLESKVAFRLVNRSGNGVDFDGMITGQHNDTVVRFHPLKFGIGNFIFTPVTGNQYKAIIKTSDGKSISVDLPTAYSQGYVMQLKDTSDNRLSITVSASDKFADKSSFLFVHDNKNIKAAQMQQLTDGRTVFIINKDSLVSGVSYFTLFNNNRQPVCERLFFKKPKAQLVVDVKTDQQNYTVRKKINIYISSADISGNSIASNLSMAVYKTDSFQIADDNNIINYLFLTSELRGNVESPGYYFQEDNNEVAEATDNLMLTHGWGRFKWEDILQTKTPLFEFAPEYEGHIITGKVINKNTGEPVEDVATFLSVPAKNYQIASAISDAQGVVKFDIKNFFGTDDIAVQTANPLDSNYRIDIMNPFSEKNLTNKIFEFNPTQSQSVNALVTNSISSQVQNIYAGENIQKLYPHEILDSTAFFGKPDQSYLLDNYTRFTTMEEVMREYIANITVRKHDGHFHYKVLNYPYKLFFEDDPLVLFDGVPVSDMNKIIAFDPLKIRKIELMNRKYFLGPYAADGIISYTTYNGDLAGFQFDPNVLIFKYDGLQLQREFYSPVYETQDQVESRLPDFRNVLYWSPDVNTNESGKKQISFYTSDAKGKYIVVVQGITNDGKAGVQTATFTIGN